MIINIPDNWLPTSENINALPRPIRDYIMRLHANTDPAGELSRAMVAEMERDALRKMIEWQPIETAPSNVAVIVFRPSGGADERVSVAKRLDVRWHFGEGFEWYWIDKQPTHWMPLPEAPDE